MPRPFAITAASNSVFLDEDRRGEASFTVSNQSGRSIDGRARLVAEDSEAEAWIGLWGSAHREFAIAGTEQFTVEIDVPPDAPSGNYTLRLDMVGEERPDEQYVEGPAVTFQVPEAEPEPEPFPWKVVAAVAAVLLIGGAVLAWALIDGEVSVDASFTVEPEAPRVGDEVRLDATGSTITGADDPAYSWSLAAPDESDAALDDPQAEVASFTPDIHGDYEIRLQVAANDARDSEERTLAIQPTRDDIRTHETGEGFAVQLNAPGAVDPGEDFEIQVAITNERAETAMVTFSNSCLTSLSVFDGEERVPLEGTLIICLTVITDRQFSAGETMQSTFDVRAALEEDGEIPPGTYTIRASPNAMLIDGEEGALPAVEQRLVVL